MAETNDDKMLELTLIQSYYDLQRIVCADNSKEEAEFQLKIVKEKLYYMGFDISKLAVLDRK